MSEENQVEKISIGWIKPNGTIVLTPGNHVERNVLNRTSLLWYGDREEAISSGWKELFTNALPALGTKWQGNVKEYLENQEKQDSTL